ncbi:ribulose bisphosphate carboxylase [Litchfieldella anticariensis FP35 = DSM 16096]|uniref:Ribulose bisphosphate carboxylase n=1 Tax=Litchfieldella anticariensis (strain DSM 16096 / CECT 5854 / CIP 108499 / LMG 22089 / FP35) TaxID=1121939 RepID=S2KFC0_LITA3|nr:ribulose-bisphosphate carboxylase large subunit family protein [Halomonas anticariensis]EPC00615.1 ribulose bisphosphate carboxylase [Halomonas anticariensis FP35 = DSM 16096]
MQVTRDQRHKPRITASYRIETPLDIEQAAVAMAGEQSSGTFLRLEGETDELRERHAARVESVVRLETVATPSLSGALPGKHYACAAITLSWPLENIGTSLPNLLATILGNLTELRELSGIRLTDITLPNDFINAFAGPQFSINGTRRLTGVANGPLIGTIIKPSVGLSPEATADLVKQLVEAGIDFIKDDELIADPPYSPLAKRVPAVMRVIEEHAQHTGRKPMYAFNITGDIDEMRQRHDLVRDHGGTCVMASVNWIGMASLVGLRRHSELPIHGHRNGWGMFYRHPQIGMSYRAYQVLLRLAGADHLHVNGLGSKFAESNGSVIDSASACLTPLQEGSSRDDRAMPVFSSAQTIHQAHATFAALQSTDLIYTCGGGIMGHPHGAAAGCRSIHAAWQAATRGVALEDYAKEEPDLAVALRAFRRPFSG